MANDKQFTETIEGKSKPTCPASNSGVSCDGPVMHAKVMYPGTNPAWFCEKHWEERQTTQ